MKLSDFCLTIFHGENLEDKLCEGVITEFDHYDFDESLFREPGRATHLSFSDKKIKFPKGDRLLTPEGRSIALHSFANHELLAIEIMAMVLLKFPHNTKEMLTFKKGLIKTLKDEQLHFKLYRELLNEEGFDFGDFSISDFFWKSSKLMTTPAEYMAIMAMTFEGANLDFTHYFSHLFREAGFYKIADVLKRVYEDELTHVALGGHYLNKWRGDSSIWNYYLESLPFPVTPARAKGIHFYEQSRKEAGLSDDFIHELKLYQNDFQVTQRRTWKSKV